MDEVGLCMEHQPQIMVNDLLHHHHHNRHHLTEEVCQLTDFLIRKLVSVSCFGVCEIVVK